MNRKNEGSILILVIVLSLLLLGSFLLYNEITKSAILDSSKTVSRIKSKNIINNVETVLKKLFDNDITSGYDWKEDFWNYSPVIPFSADGVSVNIYFYDEDSKINANLIIYPDGKINSLVEKQISNIFRKFNIDPENCNTIIDWIDSDNEPMFKGAEQEYYKENKKGLSCPNAEISTPDEFKLMKHIGKYFDSNLEDTVNLNDYISIYGDNLYNINTVSAEVLSSFDFLDNLEIESIIEFRKKFPIKNISDMPKFIPELQKKSFDLIDGYLKTSSSIIKIIIETETGGFKLKYTWVYDKVMKKTLFKKFE